MIADIVRSIVQGYLEPRRSVRAIVSTGDGLPTALLMVVLGYLIAAILVLVTPGVERMAEAGIVTIHVYSLIKQIAFFFILSGLVYFFGRVSGGTATRSEVRMAIGWHMLVTSILTPAMARLETAMRFTTGPDGQLIMPDEMPGGDITMPAFAAVAIWFWLLALYIAEVHRFRNTIGVLGVVVGIPLGAGFFILGLLGAVSVQQ